jgi:hypothetical protein
MPFSVVSSLAAPVLDHFCFVEIDFWTEDIFLQIAISLSGEGGFEENKMPPHCSFRSREVKFVL